jgi:hypothetical protein
MSLLGTEDLTLSPVIFELSVGLLSNQSLVLEYFLLDFLARPSLLGFLPSYVHASDMSIGCGSMLSFSELQSLCSILAMRLIEILEANLK